MISRACGYLLKNCHAGEMFGKTNKVYEEGFYFNNFFSRQVVTALIDEKKLQHLVSEKIVSLHKIEILQQMCNEKQDKEIADAIRG